MDFNENGVVEEITDINTVSPVEKKEQKKMICSSLYVDSIEEFISKIEEGYDLESVFLINPKKYKKLNKECKKLAKMKKVEFYFLQIRFLLNGEIKRSNKKIYKLLKKCPYVDFSYYDFYRGELYRYGIEVKQSYSKAFEYYKKATDNNVNPAFVALGECYLYGKGVQQNYALAYKNFNDASKVGNKRALLNRAILLQRGYGIDEDKKTSFELFKKLVDCDFADAFYELSMCYLFGYGTDVNYAEGIRCANEGIKRNNLKCNIVYGLNYMYGLINKKNFKKARKYFIKAIDNGFYDGCFYIGVMRFNGMGCWRSSNDALDTFLLGKEHQSLLCEEILKSMYHKKLHSYVVNRDCKKERIVLIEK